MIKYLIVIKNIAKLDMIRVMPITKTSPQLLTDLPFLIFNALTCP